MLATNPTRFETPEVSVTELTIILGNRAYSSWSLRGWLLLKRSGAAFEERVVPLFRPGFKADILRHSPSGRVPALKAGELTIWDSLAIAEYLHERYPEAGLWPEDPAVRAVARAVTAEMHAGFAALRERLPMDLKRAPQAPGGAPGGYPTLATPPSAPISRGSRKSGPIAGAASAPRTPATADSCSGSSAPPTPSTPRSQPACAATAWRSRARRRPTGTRCWPGPTWSRGPKRRKSNPG